MNSVWQCYSHLQQPALFLAGIFFLLTASAPASLVLFVCFVVPVCFSLLWVAAMWAVWGPGSYFERLCFSHLILLGYTGMGIGLGALVLFMGFGQRDFLETVASLLPLAMILPTISVAAQIPFWCLRYFLGFQLVAKDDRSRESISIRDGLLFTFMIALALASPQIALKNSIAIYEAGASLADFKDEDPGSERRLSRGAWGARHLDGRQKLARDYLIAAASVLLISAFTLPISFWIFDRTLKSEGLSRIFVYVMLCGILPIVILAYVYQSLVVLLVLPFWIVFCTVYGGGVLWLLAISDELGFQLYSPGRQKRGLYFPNPDST